MEDYSILKKNGIIMAEERGLFKHGVSIYNLGVNLRSRYISENIIRRTWDYHQKHGTNITDGQETRLIFQNCAYAGMCCAQEPSCDPDLLLNIFENNYGINRIQEYAEDKLNITGSDSFSLSLVFRGIVQDLYNDNSYLFCSPGDTEAGWEYYKAFASIMFELGALYYLNK